MDFIRQLESLTSRAEDFNGGEAVRYAAAGYQGRVAKLERPAAAYDVLASRAKVLRSAGIPFQAMEDVTTLGHFAAETLERFEADPKSIIDPPDDLRFGFWDRAGEVAVSVDRRQREAWESYVQAEMPHIDGALVELLPTVSETDRRRVLAIQDEARRLAGSVPEDEKAVERLRALADQARTLLETIGIEGLPADVRAFVGAMAKNSATLDMVTPTVLDWLRHHKLTGRILLRFSSGPQ